MLNTTGPDSLRDEFLSELRDHQYGLANFSPPNHLQSTLTLIEGHQISVTLDTRGYTVAKASGSDMAGWTGKTFETLTSLLSAVSPRFNSSMHQELFSKLQALADSSDLGQEQIR
ncbi:hypothetical protein DL89DRAFT_270569 [Linderina pennispora]|uniref:GSKIP domain-containing protein n=1 Tax=Linderina pennispora TaxID=61395 RepID=A0A1Y1VX15_9FUNG|nr:uncharacterized protein DL89DRAFT_270569 [Linderina pennispora]ORX65848.1 hypothetical protein DL89DRAFT_270569 [Linderina pennispora]